MSVPDAPLLSALPPLQQDPVFILGLARSGTTLLYSLLGKTDAVEIMTAYHMLEFDRLIASHQAGETQARKDALTRRFCADGTDTRGIDNIPLSADIPEEYGAFLLLRNGTRRLNNRTEPLFRQLCQKMQYISDRPGRPTLHKNPADFGRFREVKRLYPGAKFIFLHRHPLHVMSSSVKALMHVGQQVNPYFELQIEQLTGARRVLMGIPGIRRVLNSVASSDVAMSLIQRRILYYIDRTTSTYLKHVNELPAEDYIAVRYEDLCASPTETLERLSQFLGVDVQISAALKQEIAPRPTRLAPTVQRSERQIVQRLSHNMGALGYSV